MTQKQTNAQKELVEKSSEQEQKDKQTDVQTNRKQKLNHEKQLMERHECSQQERLR